MTQTDLMNGLQANRSYVIEMLRPQYFNISEYLLNPEDNNEIETIILKSIVWELFPECKIWKPAGERTIDEGGTAFDHIYVQSFEKDIGDAHIVFEHRGEDLWYITIKRADVSMSEERRLPALNEVLVDAYEADDRIFEDRPPALNTTKQQENVLPQSNINDIMKGFAESEDYVINFLTPDGFDIRNMEVDLTNKDEVEQCKLRAILSHTQTWTRRYENPKRVYVKGFRVDKKDAVYFFGPLTWTDTKNWNLVISLNGGKNKVEAHAPMPALERVLKKAYNATGIQYVRMCPCYKAA